MEQPVSNQQVEQELGNRELENNVLPTKKVTLWIYPVMSFFKGNDTSKELLTYSPNVVNVKLIDPDIFQKIEAEEVENPQLGYVSKQALNSIDNELAIVDQVDKSYATRENFKREPNKLYLVSEIPIKREVEISLSKFLQQVIFNDALKDARYLNQTILKTTSFEAWKPKDSNQIIIKLGKQIDDFKIDSIKIDHPKTLLIESLKILAKNDANEYGYGRTTLKPDSKTPLWLNPIELSSIGKVRLLNLWTSNRLFDLNTLKGYVSAENPTDFILELLNLNEDGDGAQPLQIRNIKQVKVVINGGYKYNIYDQNGKSKERVINDSHDFVFDNTGEKNLSLTTNVGGFYNGSYDRSKPWETAVVTTIIDSFSANSDYKLLPGSIDSIEVTEDSTIQQGSLMDLLLEELSAVYNYSLNFKYAGYIDGQSSKGLNRMALYKQEFEGKTIAEYIDGLDKAWEIKNPKYINTESYKNFKKIKVMLSKNLYGSNVVGNNTSDDSHFLLPFYFALVSQPTAVLVDGSTANADEIKNGDAVWRFSTLNLELKSNYFDCSKEKFGTSLMTDLSDKSVINSEDDSFIWQEIKNEVEESKLPSLKNSDFKISDVNVTKYLVFGDLNFKDLIGSGQNIVVNKEFFSKNQKEMNTNIEISEYQKNPKYIEITGFYGAGNYNIKLKSGEKELSLNDIVLFSKDKENVCLTKIAF